MIAGGWYHQNIETGVDRSWYLSFLCFKKVAILRKSVYDKDKIMKNTQIIVF